MSSQVDNGSFTIDEDFENSISKPWNTNSFFGKSGFAGGSSSSSSSSNSRKRTLASFLSQQTPHNVFTFGPATATAVAASALEAVCDDEENPELRRVKRERRSYVLHEVGIGLAAVAEAASSSPMRGEAKEHLTDSHSPLLVLTSPQGGLSLSSSSSSSSSPSVSCLISDGSVLSRQSGMISSCSSSSSSSSFLPSASNPLPTLSSSLSSSSSTLSSSALNHPLLSQEKLLRLIARKHLEIERLSSDNAKLKDLLSQAPALIDELKELKAQNHALRMQMLVMESRRVLNVPGGGPDDGSDGSGGPMYLS
jgi:hypothetical protein